MSTEPESGGTGGVRTTAGVAIRPAEIAAFVPPTESIVHDLCWHIRVGIHLSVETLRHTAATPFANEGA